MNRRVLYSGVWGGVVCTLFLALPLYLALPARYTAEWPAPAPWVGAAGYLFGALTALATGYVAARSGWANARRSAALMGALAGTIAALEVFLCVGAGAAGTIGIAPILRFGARPTTDVDMLVLMIDSIVRIFWATHLMLAGLLVAGAALGAAGGWLARLHDAPPWGGPPRELHGDVWEYASATMLVLSLACLVVTAELLSALKWAVDRGVGLLIRLGMNDTLPVSAVVDGPLAVNLLTLALAVWLAWRWVAGRLHRPGETGRWRARCSAWLIVVLLAAGFGSSILLERSIVLNPLFALGTLVVLGEAIFFARKVRLGWRPARSLDPRVELSLGDWVDLHLVDGLAWGATGMIGLGAAVVSVAVGVMGYIFPEVLVPIFGPRVADPTIAGTIRWLYNLQFWMSLLLGLPILVPIRLVVWLIARLVLRLRPSVERPAGTTTRSQA